jgi:iron transport multicopper oxidase
LFCWSRDSAFFNNITYVAPKVPTLYSVLTTGEAATNAAVYGRDTNTFILEHGQVIEIVLNNNDAGKHPFHLHGHNFQVVWRSEPDAGFFDANNHTEFPAVPMRRDTFMANPQGNFVVRFRADNPGVWYVQTTQDHNGTSLTSSQAMALVCSDTHKTNGEPPKAKN